MIDTLNADRCYRPGSIDSMRGDLPPGMVLGDGGPGSDDATVERLRAFDAMRQLTLRQRQILYWRFFEDRTQADIGERLGVGQVQVSRLLRAAIAQLGDHARSLDAHSLDTAMATAE